MSNISGGFTVLMCVYKYDDINLFEKAVKSVYSNTVKPDYFILIIDGPIPKTLDNKVMYLSRAHNFKIYRLNKNLGLPKALNFGLSKIKTKWVFRADADDINHPDRFISQIRFLNDNPKVDLLGTFVNEIDENGIFFSKKRLPLDFLSIKKYIKFRNPFNHNTVAYKLKCVFEAGGYPNIIFKEDYALWILLISLGYNCQNISNTTVSATTGNRFFDRRGGLNYISSEFSIQKLLVDTRLSNPFLSCAVFIARTLIFILPSFFRALVYKLFLRS